ncbi:MAG: tetratricopeptide repeat protein [Caulobacter sp.]|nr:tetratricopeptide repeat protein [Caulobacter sp.]
MLAGGARARSDEMNVGLQAYQEGRYEDAARAYQRKARSDPGNLAAWVYLGDALGRIEKPAEARRAYERALAIDLQCGGCAVAFGSFLYNRDQIEDAMRQYERAARLLPDNAQISAYLGDSYLRLDRIEDALDRYELALAIDPYLVEALSGMVRASVLAQGMTGARRRLEALKRVAPDLAAALETLVAP